MQAASLFPKSIYKNSGKIFLIINARPGSKKEGITGKYLILLNKLKEISDELNVEIHIIRKINKLTEGRVDSIKPHNSHKELYDKLKIYNIKKTYNI